MRIGAVALALALAGCLEASHPPQQPGESEPSVDGHPVSDYAWSSLPAGPTPRTEVVVGKLGHTFFVIGGFTSDSQALVPTNLVEVYDADAKTWSRGPDYPIAIHHSVAVEVNGFLYVLGGLTEGFAPTPLGFRLGGGNEPSWMPVPPMQVARGSHAAAAIGDMIYLAGGVTGTGAVGESHATDVARFDTRSQSWASVSASIPTPRDHTAGAAYKDRLYVVAGDTGGHSQNTNATEAFNVTSTRWSKLAPVPTTRGSVSAVTWRGHVVVLGGQNATQTFGSVEAFDPKNNTWIRLPPLQMARHGFGAGVLGDDLYVFYGGPKPGLTVTNTVEKLSLSAPTSG